MLRIHEAGICASTSVRDQAGSSMAERICSKVTIVTSTPSSPPPPPPPVLCRACTQTDSFRRERYGQPAWKGSTSRRRDAPQSGNSDSSAPALSESLRRSVSLMEGGVRDFFFSPSEGALPVPPSAFHPHAAQAAGLEANKARSGGAPVPCSAAAGCAWRRAKAGAERSAAAERTGFSLIRQLMLLLQMWRRCYSPNRLRFLQVM